MTRLVIPAVSYFSPSDEGAFFAWLQSISGVTDVKGQGTDLIVSLDNQMVSDVSLREFIALFHRYNLPMSLLSVFESPNNSAWLRSSAAYWYAPMFGRPKGPN